jgi:hypothetical protein
MMHTTNIDEAPTNQSSRRHGVAKAAVSININPKRLN